MNSEFSEFKTQAKDLKCSKPEQEIVTFEELLNKSLEEDERESRSHVDLNKTFKSSKPNGTIEVKSPVYNLQLAPVLKDNLNVPSASVL